MHMFLEFCTPWPKKLRDEEIKQGFPISITTREYVYSSPTIRDPRAHKVTMKVILQYLDHMSTESVRFLTDFDEGVKPQKTHTVLCSDTL